MGTEPDSCAVCGSLSRVVSGRGGAGRRSGCDGVPAIKEREGVHFLVCSTCEGCEVLV